MLVHIQPYPANPDLDVLRSLVEPGVRIHYGADLPDPPTYDILIDAFPNHERLTASANLHAVIIPFAGIPAATQDALRPYPHLSIHNLPYNYAPTAETALALLLACAKFIIPTDQLLRHNDWTPRYSDRPQIVLAGERVLLLGYGRIGRYLARILHAMEMKVWAVRRAPGVTEDSYARIHGVDMLHELLPCVKIVLCTLPDTPETAGLMGEREFALLPDGALLVNVGRAAIMDETALYEALRSGRLAGAGIDVWWNSPTSLEGRTNTAPSRYPFHELSNVVMSPHRAGWLGTADGGRTAMLAEMLNVAATGAVMPNQVDLMRGY